MTMREEKLKLVASFDELRAGMIVVAKGCTYCGGQHRGILTRLHRAGTWTDLRLLEVEAMTARAPRAKQGRLL